MTPQEQYFQECIALVQEITPFVSSSGLEDVRRLIDHQEAAIGLNMLAWGIVEDDVKVPDSIIARLRRLVEGTSEAAHLPPGLDSHGIPGQ